MTTITDARAREFWCAVFLQSGDAGLRVAVEERDL